ncbi:secreted RxLR effector protein 161-like [Rutidosis leptorrhynchoides]|uniref:secreted RxLR effector protein 161-like n=1 Tax=Rutidosis leptorrhynchoides TaxID=125765 RepID=UPI003A99B7FA
MIGSLMYLTVSQPGIMFTTCLCPRYQANPKESHFLDVKCIVRYLKGTMNLGLWYPKETCFDLVAYSNSDYGGCKIDRKSTSGSVQFLEDKLVSLSSNKQHWVATSTAEAEYVAAAKHQLADLFTKPLDEQRFNFLKLKLGMLTLLPDTDSDV